MMQSMPSGSTTVFPVLGDPIDQVRSPAVVTRLFIEQAEDAIVVPMHIAPRDLAEIFSSLHKAGNVGGMLVTVPHKQAAFGLCASASERAAFVGSANVVRRTSAGWHGDNTDGAGYLDGIEKKGFFVKDGRCLLVGCGGAGSAIALEILKRGASSLAIHDIDVQRRDLLIAKLDGAFPGRLSVGSDDPGGFDLVANATPLGMRPGDAFPVDVTKLEARQFVACVVTKPEVPRLIEEARRRGCKAMTGSDMFDAQSETLADFLLGRPAPQQVNFSSPVD